MEKERLEKISKILFWVQSTLLILSISVFLMLTIPSNVYPFGGILSFYLISIFFIEILLTLFGFIFSIQVLRDKEIKNKKWGKLLLLISIIFLFYEIYWGLVLITNNFFIY